MEGGGWGWEGGAVWGLEKAVGWDLVEAVLAASVEDWGEAAVMVVAVSRTDRCLSCWCMLPDSEGICRSGRWQH